MASYYVKSGAGAAEFAQSTAYTTGQKIVVKRSDTGTNYLVARRYVWECTTAGTSAAAEPTWPSSVTADTTTVTSSGAVFTARKPGYSSGTTANWTFASPCLDYPGALAVAGDVVYVSNNHAESVSVAWGDKTGAWVTGVSYVCVDDSATPPTTLGTTATVESTSGVTIGAGSSYVYGIAFTSGIGGSTQFSISSTGFFELCKFIIASTGAFSNVSATSNFWRKCDVKFGGSQAFISFNGRLVWNGGSLLSGGTTPSALFGSANGAAAIIENIDLSNAGSTMNISNSTSNNVTLIARNIKLPASWSGALHSSTPASVGFCEMSATDNTGAVHTYQNKTNGGAVYHETTLVRTGGASNGATPLSYKMVCTSSAQFPQIRARTPDIVKWNSTTGRNVTVTVELLHDSATALTDGECWLEVNHYGESGSPLGSYSSSAKGFLASASNLTTSTETWTTTGMSNPNKQNLSVTFAPALAGYVIARVMLAKASKTIYVDPVLTLS